MADSWSLSLFFVSLQLKSYTWRHVQLNGHFLCVPAMKDIHTTIADVAFLNVTHQYVGYILETTLHCFLIIGALEQPPVVSPRPPLKKKYIEQYLSPCLNCILWSPLFARGSLQVYRNLNTFSLLTRLTHPTPPRPTPSPSDWCFSLNNIKKTVTTLRCPPPSSFSIFFQLLLRLISCNTCNFLIASGSFAEWTNVTQLNQPSSKTPEILIDQLLGRYQVFNLLPTIPTKITTHRSPPSID